MNRDKTFTKIPNKALDEIMSICSSSEWKVYCVILRKTVGWNKRSDQISISQFQKLAGIKKRNTIIKSIQGLLDKDIISRKAIGQRFEYKIIDNQDEDYFDDEFN